MISGSSDGSVRMRFEGQERDSFDFNMHGVDVEDTVEVGRPSLVDSGTSAESGTQAPTHPASPKTISVVNVAGNVVIDSVELEENVTLADVAQMSAEIMQVPSCKLVVSNATEVLQTSATAADVGTGPVISLTAVACAYIPLVIGLGIDSTPVMKWHKPIGLDQKTSLLDVFKAARAVVMEDATSSPKTWVADSLQQDGMHTYMKFSHGKRCPMYQLEAFYVPSIFSLTKTISDVVGQEAAIADNIYLRIECRKHE